MRNEEKLITRRKKSYTRGQSNESNTHGETNHSEHVGKLHHIGRPKHRERDRRLVVESSVDNDNAHHTNQNVVTSLRSKGNGSMCYSLEIK